LNYGKNYTAIRIHNFFLNDDKLPLTLNNIGLNVSFNCFWHTGTCFELYRAVTTGNKKIKLLSFPGALKRADNKIIIK